MVGTRLRFGRTRRSAAREAGTRTAGSTPADLVGAYFADATGTQRIGGAYLAVAATDADVTTLLGEIAPPHADPASWWQ